MRSSLFSKSVKLSSTPGAVHACRYSSMHVIHEHFLTSRSSKAVFMSTMYTSKPSAQPSVLTDGNPAHNAPDVPAAAG